MNYEIKPYSVYIKTDESGRITAINSDAFLTSFEGWQKIAEGYGDKHHHAQGNYLNQSLFNDFGVANYKYSGGTIEKRTEAEMEADKPQEVESPTNRTEERLEALEKGLTALKMLFTSFIGGNK